MRLYKTVCFMSDEIVSNLQYLPKTMEKLLALVFASSSSLSVAVLGLVFCDFRPPFIRIMSFLSASRSAFKSSLPSFALSLALVKSSLSSALLSVSSCLREALRERRPSPS